jgi:hypothetical protein
VVEVDLFRLNVDVDCLFPLSIGDNECRDFPNHAMDRPLFA